MGITSSNKVISTDHISCGDTLRVTLSLSAAPDIASNPTDIVLVLDCSTSMTGSPLAHMKTGAKQFIDIITTSTGGAPDGDIGGGSRIGLVSFATAASQDAPLMTDSLVLKSMVDALKAGGSTNHADAFTAAVALFDPASTNNRVIVLFTDGKTTAGDPPAPIAAAARADGIVIYAIGLDGSGGVDADALKDWASDPDDTHVAITPDETELAALFAQLAANISKPGATDIVIDEILNNDFVIEGPLTPTKGTAVKLTDTALRWSIESLGKKEHESAELTFTIRHVGLTGGLKKVNHSITYHDHEGNKVTFPDPAVQVDCGVIVHPEPCPRPVEVKAEGCEDAVFVDLGDAPLTSLGRILTFSVTVPNVCPNKRAALAIILTEVDHEGHEHPRGLKTVTIPAHHQSGCRNVRVECIKFVVPEDLDVNGSPNSICDERKFRVRVLVNYIDTDFVCC